MAKNEKPLKVPAPPAAPLSTQVKAVIVMALVIGGVGLTFGAMSIGPVLGNNPVNNYSGGDTYTYNNYTTYQTFYNTTYIYNNATGQRSLYNCCLFQVVGLPQYTVAYFFNLTLKSKTVIELFMIKNTAGEDLNNVEVRYNLSVDEHSERVSGYFLQKNLMGVIWYLGPETDGGTKINLPHILPNGSTYICQFRIQHTDTSLGSFQILIGYTVYL